MGLIFRLLEPPGAHFWPPRAYWGSFLACCDLLGLIFGVLGPPGRSFLASWGHFGAISEPFWPFGPPPEVFCEPSRRPVRRLRAPRHTIESTVRNHSPKDLSRPLHARSAPGRWLGGRFGGASPTGDPAIEPSGSGRAVSACDLWTSRTLSSKPPTFTEGKFP